MRPTFSAAFILAALAAILPSTGCATKGLFVPHIVSERVTIRDVEARSIAAIVAAPGSQLGQQAVVKSAPAPARAKRTEPATAGTTGFSYADALVAAFTGGGAGTSEANSVAGSTPLASLALSKAQPVPIALIAWFVVVVLVGVLSGGMFYLNRARWLTTSKRENHPPAERGIDDFLTERQLPSVRR